MARGFATKAAVAFTCLWLGTDAAEALSGTWTRRVIYTDDACTSPYEPNWGTDTFQHKVSWLQDTCLKTRADANGKQQWWKVSWADATHVTNGRYDDDACTIENALNPKRKVHSICEAEDFNGVTMYYGFEKDAEVKPYFVKEGYDNSDCSGVVLYEEVFELTTCREYNYPGQAMPISLVNTCVNGMVHDIWYLNSATCETSAVMSGGAHGLTTPGQCFNNVTLRGADACTGEVGHCVLMGLSYAGQTGGDPRWPMSSQHAKACLGTGGGTCNQAEWCSMNHYEMADTSAKCKALPSPHVNFVTHLMTDIVDVLDLPCQSIQCSDMKKAWKKNFDGANCCKSDHQKNRWTADACVAMKHAYKKSACCGQPDKTVDAAHFEWVYNLTDMTVTKDRRLSSDVVLATFRASDSWSLSKSMEEF